MLYDNALKSSFIGKNEENKSIVLFFSYCTLITGSYVQNEATSSHGAPALFPTVDILRTSHLPPPSAMQQSSGPIVGAVAPPPGPQQGSAAGCSGRPRHMTRGPGTPAAGRRCRRSDACVRRWKWKSEVCLTRIKPGYRCSDNGSPSLQQLCTLRLGWMLQNQFMSFTLLIKGDTER